VRVTDVEQEPVPTPPSPVVIVSWNLQGSQGVDVDGVADVLAAARADVIVIQEIQRRQARRVARRLGITEMRWVFKHFPLTTWSEGLAVLTPHRLVDTDSFVLRRAWFWNWRRRVGLVARIERGDEQFGVINVHLSPHDAGEQRRREAHLVVERARSEPEHPLIAGDFNDLPDGPCYQVFTGSGWTDAWLIDKLQDNDGATNWTSGARRGRAPTQRLDFVFAPAGWTVADARVLAESDRLDWFAERSDHVPLVAELHPPTKDPH
jgi:endonuclease/exonuclease/phosphatase family metal-dependent hydrolase